MKSFKKAFRSRLGSQLTVLYKFYSIKLQILKCYKSFDWKNVPRAGISFPGHKEIFYTVLNEPPRESVEQQISLQQGEQEL